MRGRHVAQHVAHAGAHGEHRLRRGLLGEERACSGTRRSRSRRAARRRAVASGSCRASVASGSACAKSSIHGDASASGNDSARCISCGRGLVEPARHAVRDARAACATTFGMSQIVNAISTRSTTSDAMGCANASHSIVPTASVLAERRGPVRERLRRRVDQRAAAGLGEVAAAASVPPTMAAATIQARRRIAEDARRERGARGNANERLHEIPHRIDARDLVGEELHEAHEARRREHERMREHGKAAGQVDPVQKPSPPSDEQHGVEAHAAGPADGGRRVRRAATCRGFSAWVTLHLSLRSSAGHPRADALAEERGHALLAFRRRANGRDALHGVGDHAGVDRPVRDGADQRLAFALRCGPGDSSGPRISLTRSSSCASGTMSCTRPMRYASAASKRSAVRK